MQFPHFACDIPASWHDTSTVRFVIPAPITDARMVKNTGPTTIGNVVLTWARAEGRTPAMFLAEQRDELKKLSRFKLHGNEDSGELPYLDYTFRHGDKQLRQIMYVRAVGDTLVCIVCSSREVAFESLRSQFLSVAQSVR